MQMVSRLCKSVMDIGVILPNLRLQTLEGFVDQILDTDTTLPYKLVEWL